MEFKIPYLIKFEFEQIIDNGWHNETRNGYNIVLSSKSPKEIEKKVKPMLVEKLKKDGYEFKIESLKISVLVTFDIDKLDEL